MDYMYVNHYHFCYTIGWSHERCLPWRASHAFILCLFTNIMDRRQSSAVKWYKHKPKVPSRMDNPERTDGAIKNRQSRENRRCHQEWTIQRKPTVPSRMDNPEKTDDAIKNEQSREISNMGYTKHKTNTNKTKNTTQYVLDTTICKQTQIT